MLRRSYLLRFLHEQLNCCNIGLGGRAVKLKLLQTQNLSEWPRIARGAADDIKASWGRDPMSAEPTTLLPSYSDHDGGPRRCTGVYRGAQGAEGCNALVERYMGAVSCLPSRPSAPSAVTPSPCSRPSSPSSCNYAPPSLALSLCSVPVKLVSRQCYLRCLAPFHSVWQSSGNNLEHEKRSTKGSPIENYSGSIWALPK